MSLMKISIANLLERLIDQKMLTTATFIRSIRTILDTVTLFLLWNTHSAGFTLELEVRASSGSSVVAMQHGNVIERYPRVWCLANCCFDVDCVGVLLTNEDVRFAPTVTLIA
jgi:hypothetical protein